jgi:Uma2 family endonuclease
MLQTLSQKLNSKHFWTTADLESLPSYEESGDRYEIINGDLFVTRAPHWQHQSTCGNIYAALKQWSSETGLGQPAIAPGIIFASGDNVIPDLVWASNQVLASMDRAGHLTVAPELVIEVLSSGTDNERRDKVIKLKLYGDRGVQEYWLVDWRLQWLEVYRASEKGLEIVKVFLVEDRLTTPLLPQFCYDLVNSFA